MGTKKLLGTKEQDPDWIIELVDAYLQKDIKGLTDYQKKMLCDQYFEYLRDGFNPKDAIEKAFKIVSCFS